MRTQFYIVFVSHFFISMKKLFILFFSLAMFFVVVALPVSAEELPIRNTGFVEASIWYSRESFFQGDKVRIYTIVFNGSPHRLEGTVEFYDNDILIGAKNFILPGDGRVQDIWVDWAATEGKHIIVARMAKIVAIFPDGKKYPVLVGNVVTGKSERNVDFDTDKDGIGNREDVDDDNDRVLDADEVKGGTDPLKKDTDGNGVSDGKEIELALLHKALGEANLMKQKAQAVGRMESAAVAVENAVPVPVKQGFVSTKNVVENFRLETGHKLRSVKEATEKDIVVIKERERLTQDMPSKISEISDTTEKPAAYAMLALVTFAEYIFKWTILFYGILVYVVYRLVLWIVRRVRAR